MTRYILVCCLFFLLAHTTLFSQRLRVLDKESLESVSNVLAKNVSRGMTAVSGSGGFFDGMILYPGDTIIFQHHSYYQEVYTYDSIQSMEYIAYLRPRAYDIEGVTVTGYRWEQDRTETPIHMISVSAGEIAFQNPQTTADLLGQTHKVFIQKSQLGGGSPMLRGFAANSVLIVIDGVRMNNAIYRSGNLHNVISLDPNFIENTNVIFGPSSVIYGSDALGGVMVFNTHQPVLAIEQDRIFNVRSAIRHATATEEKSAHVRINAGSRRWASMTGFTYSGFGDLRTGSRRTAKFPDHGKRFEYVSWDGNQDQLIPNENPNKLIPSGYDQLNVSQKLRYRPSDSTDVTYGFHFSRSSDIPRYDRLIEYRDGLPRFAQWNYGPQLWMMHNISGTFYRNNGLFDKNKTILAYQFNEESRHNRRLNDLSKTNRKEQVHALILNSDFEKVINENTQLFYGIEGLYNRVFSEASSVNIVSGARQNASTRYPDGENHYGSLAMYGFLQRRMNDKTVLNAGVRYSHVMLHSTLKDTIFYNFPFREIRLNAGAFTGTLGMAYQLQKGLQLNANLSSGFRAPNLDDAGKVFESEPGNVVVPNPDLKPEHAINAEAGIIVNNIRWLHLELNLFYTRLLDVMVRRDFQYLGSDSIFYNNEWSNVQAIVNAGRGYIYGGSIGGEINVHQNACITSSITYTYGRELGTEERYPLRHIPPLYGATSFCYTVDRLRVEAAIEYHAAKKWDDLDPSEQNKTHLYTEDGSLAWYTLNLKASMKIFDYLELNTGIENILDKHYWPYASGIPGPGRNVYIALRLSI